MPAQPPGDLPGEDSTEAPDADCCGTTAARGGRDLTPDRRQFLKLAGAGAASLVAMRSSSPAMAGPFDQADDTGADYRTLIPADKELSPEWVRSLFARGDPVVCHGDELRYIGMPVGGICAGTVYLGGDGKLWLWDIFNQHHLGCVPRELVSYRGAKLREVDGANYVDPLEQQSPFDLSVWLIVGGEELDERTRCTG